MRTVQPVVTAQSGLRATHAVRVRGHPSINQTPGAALQAWSANTRQDDDLIIIWLANSNSSDVFDATHEIAGLMLLPGG